MTESEKVHLNYILRVQERVMHWIAYLHYDVAEDRKTRKFYDSEKDFNTLHPGQFICTTRNLLIGTSDAGWFQECFVEKGGRGLCFVLIDVFDNKITWSNAHAWVSSNKQFAYVEEQLRSIHDKLARFNIPDQELKFTLHDPNLPIKD